MFLEELCTQNVSPHKKLCVVSEATVISEIIFSTDLVILLNGKNIVVLDVLILFFHSLTVNNPFGKPTVL